MHAQPRRALQLAAAALVGAFLLVWGPGQVSPASAFCDSSLCASPEGLAVLADSDAMSGLAGGSVGTADGIAASAALEAGVGGISLDPIAASAIGGTAGLGLGAGAYVGIKSWKSGNVNVAAGGATGLSAGAAPAGWVGTNNGPGHWTNSNNYAQTATTVEFDVSGDQSGAAGTGVTLGWSVVGAANPYGSAGFLYPWTSGYGGWTYRLTFSDGSTVNAGGANQPMGAVAPTTTYTVPSGKTLLSATPVGNGQAFSPIWYSEASPNRPASAPAGSGTITRTLVCTDGTTTATVTDNIPVNIANQGSYPFGDLNCPAGMVVQHFKADLTPSTGGSPQPVIPDTTTSPDVTSIPSEYPQCLTSSCALRLYKLPVGQPTGTPSLDCGDGAAACPDWYTDPARASDYECHWGPYTVTLDRCSVYRVPGEVLPNSYVAPDGTTTYVAWPPLPGASASAAPSPTSGDCWPSGYSAFNPLQWVLMPVECAMRWAFVPSTATSTAWQSFVSDAEARPPVNVAVGGVQFTNAVISGLSGAGDCTTLPLQMAGGPMGPAASFDLCAGVQQAGQTSWGQLLRQALEVAIIGGGCWIAYHRIAASFGGKG